MSRAQGQLWFPKPAAKAAAKSIGVFLGIMRRSTLKSVVDAFRYVVSYGRRQRRLGFGFLRRRRFPETLMRFASSAQREQDRSLLSGQTVNAGQTRLQDYKAFVAQVRASFTLVSIRGQHRPFAVCAPARLPERLPPAKASASSIRLASL